MSVHEVPAPAAGDDAGWRTVPGSGGERKMAR